MNLSASAARVNFHEVESALDRGERVEITLDDGRIFELQEKPESHAPVGTAESRAAMFDSWKGKARLIEGWDSPEANAEIWEEFWLKLEDEEPIPVSPDARNEAAA